MNDVILHIGPHKTGTTSLQSFLRDRFGEPVAGGDWYPPTGGRTPGHTSLARAIMGLPPRELEMPSLAALRERATQQGCRSLILSSEAFSLAYRRKLDAVVAAFAGWRIHLCVTLSPIVRRTVSTWQQLVRAGETRSLEASVDEILRHPGIAPDLVRKFLDALRPQRCSVVLVDPAAHSVQLPRDFCAAAGLDAGPLAETPRLNDSIGELELEMVRHFNLLAQQRDLASSPRRLLVEFLKSDGWREVTRSQKSALPPQLLPPLLERAERTIAELEDLAASGRIAVRGDLGLLRQCPTAAAPVAAAGRTAGP